PPVSLFPRFAYRSGHASEGEIARHPRKEKNPGPVASPAAMSPRKREGTVPQIPHDDAGPHPTNCDSFCEILQILPQTTPESPQKGAPSRIPLCHSKDDRPHDE